jgi:hypothetical protein
MHGLARVFGANEEDSFHEAESATEVCVWQKRKGSQFTSTEYAHGKERSAVAIARAESRPAL